MSGTHPDIRTCLAYFWRYLWVVPARAALWTPDYHENTLAVAVGRLFAPSAHSAPSVFTAMSPYILARTDGSLSLLEHFEFNATTNPSHPLFLYDSASAPQGYEDITWKQAMKMFRTTAKIIRHHVGSAAVECTSRPVVGILASTSAILYASLMFGTLRAGCAVFPLSTRNSDAAIAHLIAESGVKYLLVSQDAHMQEIARKANRALLERDVHISIFPIPTYEEISADVEVDLPPIQPLDDERVMIIAHSSGSTSFPKVIPLTEKYFRLFALTAANRSTQVQSMHGTAMFHAMGFNTLIRAIYSGVISAYFSPTTHAAIATPERLLACALATKCTDIMCPPMFLEHWVQDPSSIEKLRTFSSIMFGGGPLPQSVGDTLDKNGVRVRNSYGCSEIGLISGHSDHTDGWDFFQFCPTVEPVLIPVDGDTSGLLFQLILKQCETNCLALTNTEVDGVPALDMKDIVQRHPTNPTLYRLYGRADDQIMHSNGEKTNPGPIEHILVQDPLIEIAIMFGRERPHAGVIIAPAEDVGDLESFRDAIWPTIEQANAFAPSHSRIFKEMIILATPSRPLQLTAKGTPRRQMILEDYAADIDAAYVAFDRSGTATGPPAHEVISMVEALEIVRGHVRTNIGLSISDNENIFDAGADSLLAARIRRDVIQSLGGRVPEAAIKAIPNDIVFTSPTVAQLTSFVYGVGVGASVLPHTSKESDTPLTNAPAPILDYKDSTVVPLRNSTAGEPPLILIHGGSGFIYAFAYMQTHFRTGLWAIQVTDETPRTSFVAQTDFYYHKIKEAQPKGPYRLGGYSAGGFMACRIAKLVEADGEEVIQLALIDNSPFLRLAPRQDFTYAPETDFGDPQTLRAHEERGIRGLCAMLRRYNDPWWPKFADCAWERWNGRMRAEEMSELMARAYENLVEGSPKAFEFILSLTSGGRLIYKEVLQGLIEWLKEVKTPVTLYKGSHGALRSIPPEAQKEWWAAGLDWCCQVRVVELDADHSSIVNHGKLIEDLQIVTQGM
ncbi:hypothetical protein DFH06DRAFT_1472553 [Mycena polygramma]|nr:hypothetical protein DFH06DRAFT_1472553 [Mycena polygramma]